MKSKVIKENVYRTHSCGELRIENVGAEVRLAGFVASIRKFGGITFVVLRDHYGSTQLIIDEKLMAGVTKECTITVEGSVVERTSKNANMPTGDIEVVVKSLKVLGKCNNVLPFEVLDNNAKEDVRLKYRYLNLRNPLYHQNIVRRAEILNYTRNKMTEMGFTEVQTPILTSSSPEGARDFIVPTILSPGEFFALPQAPQQFKQLLMISGFDKYFQIAPCFRNEAARADRTPGEFYQIDLEMSFATQEDVFAVCEELAHGLYSKFTKFDLCKKPFKRIPYLQAMELYCSDKPDLRNPLIVKDLTEIFKDSGFSALSGKVVKAICCPAGEQPRRFYDELSKIIVDNEGKGVIWYKYNDNQLAGSSLKYLSETEIKNMVSIMQPKNGDSLFLVADNKPRIYNLANVLRNELGARCNLIDNNRVEFCWITDFPFFEANEDTGAIEFSHNPFSMPQGGMDALLNQNPFEIKAYQYDLVCNGYEMLSGAVRNHDPEVMVKAFEMAGYPREVVENKFPALFNAFNYGAPPHAGAAFGFDRMLMPILGADNIRDVIAFPLTKSGKDLLMGAPSKIDEKTLRELGIKVDK